LLTSCWLESEETTKKENGKRGEFSCASYRQSQLVASGMDAVAVPKRGIMVARKVGFVETPHQHQVAVIIRAFKLEWTSYTERAIKRKESPRLFKSHELHS